MDLYEIIFGRFCTHSTEQNYKHNLFLIFSNDIYIPDCIYVLVIHIFSSGPSSLTEIISYVSQTLDAFVRARDLLSLFSEILLSDLLHFVPNYLYHQQM